MLNRGAPGAGKTIAACAVVTIFASGCTGPSIQHEGLDATDLRITDYPYNADIRGDELPVEIAHFDAPVSQPGEFDERIELGFLRYPAAENTHGSPIVFLLDEENGTVVSQQLINRLRAFGEVVFFSRRGYGFSSPPPPCPSRLNYPLDQPLSQEELGATVCEYRMTCLQSLALSPANYAQEKAVSDLESLRQVLEAENLVVIADQAMADTVRQFQRQRPERVAQVAIIGGAAAGPAPDLDKALATLKADLADRPARTSYAGRSGRSISITIAALDLEFLRTRVSGERERQELLVAVSAATSGDFAMLAELTLRGRQRLSEVSTIELLTAGDSEQCRAPASALSDQRFAAAWPHSALSAGARIRSAVQAESGSVTYPDNVVIAAPAGSGETLENRILDFVAATRAGGN